MKRAFWLLVAVLAVYFGLFTFNSLTRARSFSPDSMNYVDVARRLAAGDGLGAVEFAEQELFNAFARYRGQGGLQLHEIGIGGQGEQGGRLESRAGGVGDELFREAAHGGDFGGGRGGGGGGKGGPLQG